MFSECESLKWEKPMNHLKERYEMTILISLNFRSLKQHRSSKPYNKNIYKGKHITIHNLNFPRRKPEADKNLRKS